MAKRKSDNQKSSTTEHKAIVGVIIGVVVLLVGAIFLVGSFGGEPGRTRDTATAGESDGKALYGIYCMGCHGDQGQGYILPDAPPLNAEGKVWQYSDDEIIEFIIRDGGELMPSMEDSLTDEEMLLINAYIKEWWTPEQREAQPGGS